MKEGLTHDRVRELLHYDQETGVFTWRAKAARQTIVGSVAGCITGAGYIVIRIDGNLHYAHRLAWLWQKGCHPESLLDHINRDKTDNRILNLREANHQENMWNSSSTGFYWRKRRSKWHARICSNGRVINLGYFDCMLAARAAYLRARKEMFGEFS